MGEVVEGDAHLQSVDGDRGGIDEVVFSDGEEFVVEGSIEGQATSSKQQQQQRQKRKRKRINDWVVQSFANRSKPTTSSSSSKQQQESSLWKTVEHSAIIQAAWEGRAAEQLAWQKKRGTRPKKSGNGDHDNEDDEEEDEESLLPDVAKSSSGYGASKMFQSVMTRSMAAVGSNGRLPGAYPMDALPIEECANRRGVLDLGRRYGYGDWSNNYNDDVGDYSDDEEKEDELFGGGDLFAVESASSRKRRSRRNKKSNSAPSMDNERRRRRKKASSVKLGMSGGGASDHRSNHRVSIEFDMISSPSHRTASSRRREPSISTPAPVSRRLEMNDIKSKLSERNILFMSDSRVKAPTELLRKSKLRKSEDEL